MRVGIVMFYDEPIRKYGELNHSINSNYCAKHGFELIVSHQRQYVTRHPAWERLPLLLKYISDYDYLVWIDADAFFYPDASSIVDVIAQHPDQNFIFSNDIGNTNVNTGILIVKNSDYSVGFLTKWAYDDTLYRNNSMPQWWDQGVLIDMYQTNVLDIQSQSVSIPYGVLQHFYESELSQLKNKPLVLHLAGRSHDERVTSSFAHSQKR